MKKFLLLLFLLLPVISEAQFIRRFNYTADPSGTCQNNYLAVNITTNTPFLCMDGWKALGIATGSLTAGQVVFPNASNQLSGSSQFFWDDTNKRLGIGTSASSPNAQLQVGGQVSLDAGDAVTGFFLANRASGQAWALNTNLNMTVLGKGIALENDVNNSGTDAGVDYTSTTNQVGGTWNICGSTKKCGFGYNTTSAGVDSRFRWGYLSQGWDVAGFAAIADSTSPAVTGPGFYSYASANALQILAKFENDNGVSPVAAIGLCVSSSGASESTAPTGGPGSCKAGIGLLRSAANGRGTLNFYNRATNDANDFDGTDSHMSMDSSGNVGIAAAINASYALTIGGGILSTAYTSNIATGTAPLVVTSTTPVVNLTAVPVTYNKSGTQQTNAHIVQDSCTLGTDCAVTLTGASVFTNSTSYTVVCQDDTAIAACNVVQASGSAFTITGTGTDVIRYIAIGN